MFYYVGSILLGWKIVVFFHLPFRPPIVWGVRCLTGDVDEAVWIPLLHGLVYRKKHTVKERACLARKRRWRFPPRTVPKCRDVILGALLKQVWTIKSL